MRRKGEGGWFTIPGVQEGERTLEEGVRGLGILAHEARAKSVLDLGCAEGLIGQWFIRHGAASVDGLDISRSAIETAWRLSDGQPIRFDWADFDRPGTWPRLRPTYDIVLLLSVLHKLSDPKRILGLACQKARHWLAVRAPGGEVGSIDIVETVCSQGFVPASKTGDGPICWVFFRCT